MRPLHHVVLMLFDAITDPNYNANHRDDGVGLAAPQVGVNVRLMVFNPEGRSKPGNEQILCNPEIISTGAQKIQFEEGCLSFPEVYGRVEVRATHATGPMRIASCACVAVL